MSGSAPTNNAAVDFEKQQAAEADAKEAARQARLTQGQQLIDQIFNGQPVMGTKTSNYDWSTFTPTPKIDAATAIANSQGANIPVAADTSIPAGYKRVQVAPKGSAGAGVAPGTMQPVYNLQGQVIGQRPAGRTATPYTIPQGTGNTATSGATSGDTGASGAGTVTALQGPDGKIYYQGDPLSVTSTYDTGKRTGGFDDDFYNNYRQRILDYYNPDEQRQYDEAQRDLRYNLARAGTLQSSTAADKQGELAYKDAEQKANIVANANTQTGNLKSQIQANKQALINQLYTTEDPTLTANLAESSAAASRLQDPTLTPAAALFSPALTTVGSAVSGMLYPGQTYNSPFNTASGSPTPTSASSSSGKVIPV